MSKETRAVAVASLIHLNWLEGLYHTDGYKPCMVKTTDRDWIEMHGTDYFDLAEYQYHELPDDWQSSYRLTAEKTLLCLLTP